MDSNGFWRDFSDSGAWVSGLLWQPVAGCGALWQKAVAPTQYHAQSFGLAGWQDDDPPPRRVVKNDLKSQ